jgi:hypothetical protein
MVRPKSLQLRSAFVAALVLPIGTTCAPSAQAQEAPGAAAPGALADVVKLKDGSLFRGTITELVAGDHIDLLLPSGQTRQFAMSEVAYAGPAPSAAPAAPAPVTSATPVEPAYTVTGRKVAVHVEADEPGTQLLVKAGQGEVSGVGYAFGAGGFVYGGRVTDYAALCSAPCDLGMLAGTHQFALSRGSGGVLAVDPPVEIEQASTLKARIESRRGIRVAGLLILTVGVVGGLVLVGTSTSDQRTCDPSFGCSTTREVDSTRLGIGLTAVIVSTIAGIVMLVTHDKASIEVVPSAAARLPLSPGHTGDRAFATPESPDTVPGMTLRVRF